MTDYDIAIVGTGAGGGTLAWRLRSSGARILLIERGDFLPPEPENWSPAAVFADGRYKPEETWEDSSGSPFTPGVHYFVGGNTKVYGAALPRFRREDFEPMEHEEGTSPAWPISYEELEPYYVRAESLYGVRGTTGEDPTDPPRSAPYPFPAVPHEPQIEELAAKLRTQGLRPFHLPMGVDLGNRCLRCHTCDGFPCRVHAKSDAETRCVRPALESSDVELWTRTFARRVLVRNGRVEGIEVERHGAVRTVRAATYVISAGAVNSAALLLRSDGIPDGSGMIGCNYMVHNNSALMAMWPLRRNVTTFQKTLAINDWYLKGPDSPWPLGNLQLIGKVQGSMLQVARPGIPASWLNYIANRSLDWWVMSEDLPDRDNRVTIANNGRIRIHWRPTNVQAHKRLMQASRSMLRTAGFAFTFDETMGIATNSHQCGTLRMGHDPASSVLDPWCRMHGLKNLFVVDASFFPSSGAMNPALTIAAQALRVADHLNQSRT